MEEDHMDGSSVSNAPASPIEILKRMSGLEFLAAMRDRRLPGPPIADLLNFGITEVEPGRVVFTGRPGPQHYNPIGSVHGGYSATLLDSCMSCAVQTMLAAGIGYTTVEIKVNMVRPITAETGEIRAEGKVLSSGRRIATSEGRIVDSSGRLLAHGTATCLILDLATL